MWGSRIIHIGDVKFTFGIKAQLEDEAAKFTADLIRSNGMPVPQHVAFCMDGNRRFAKKHSLGSGTGHVAGFESMVRVLVGCSRLGVKSATVYAFSIENFNRSPEESETLFSLVRAKLWTMVNDRDSAMRQLGWQIRFPGNRQMLEPDLVERMNDIESVTSEGDGMVVNICAPYTTRDDLTTAMVRCCSLEEPVTRDGFVKQRHMDPAEPLDVFIRTSGETRLSDFMAWELDSSCMVEFVPQLWPEFSVWSLYRIVIKWQMQLLKQHYALQPLESLGKAPPQVSVNKK